MDVTFYEKFILTNSKICLNPRKIRRNHDYCRHAKRLLKHPKHKYFVDSLYFNTREEAYDQKNIPQRTV